MARLRLNRDEEKDLLWEPFSIGRSSRSSDLTLDHASISAIHAVIRWSGARWEIRDLSSNGTWVDGKRVPSGHPVALRVGAIMRFGQETTVEVTDLGPPEPCARGSAGRVTGEDGLLALPNTEAPQATVTRDAEGRWWLEDIEQRRRVEDGEEVRVGEEDLRLELPSLGATEPCDGGVFLDAVRTRIGVSRDEESVAVVLDAGGGPHDLGIRSHHYLMLTLARLREQDSTLPQAERGWVDGKSLQRMLGVTENLLYTHIFRVRRHFIDLGVIDAERVIERRGSGQLRLGIGSVEIHPL